MIVDGLMSSHDGGSGQQSLWCDGLDQQLYRIPVLVLSVEVSFEERRATSFEVEQKQDERRVREKESAERSDKKSGISDLEEWRRRRLCHFACERGFLRLSSRKPPVP